MAFGGFLEGMRRQEMGDCLTADHGPASIPSIFLKLPSDPLDGEAREGDSHPGA